MATFDVGKLLNKIKDDIPGINAVLRALAKWDVSTFTDVPEGAMQATTDANKRLTLKQLIAGTWAPITKLMHDVDTVDGYHASTASTAGTIPVRDQHGALVGNITGNAATATEAEKLSAGAVVPVNQGGTGATTSSGARANLGAAAGADFEEHKNLEASITENGHVKLANLAYDGTATAAPGGYGLGTSTMAILSANVSLPGGTYSFNYSDPNFDVASLPNDPNVKYCALLVSRRSPTSVIQLLFGGGTMWSRTYNAVNNTGMWYRLPNTISDVVNGTSPFIAASERALAEAYAAAQAAVVPVKTANVHIYISKTGSDANSGLTEAKALQSWNKASDILHSMRYSRGANIYLHFGPGDWGNVTIFGNTLTNSYIRITSITNTIGSATDYANLPKFGQLYLYDGLFAINNVTVDCLLALRYSWVIIAPYTRFGRVRSEHFGYILFNSGTYDIYSVSATYAMSVSTAGVIQAVATNTVFNFEGPWAYSTGTATADYTGSILFRGNSGYVSFTGAVPVGRKFFITTYSRILVYGVNSYDFFPGTKAGEIASAASYNGEGDVASTVGDFAFSFASAKAGHLICEGAPVSRTTYANLFAAVGTKFGVGDGKTTFNVPDMRGKVLQGANGNLGAYLAAGLPNITGRVGIGALVGGGSGAMYVTPDVQWSIQRSTTDASNQRDIAMDASRSSAIYGKSTTVQPPALALNVFIKF